MAVPSHNKSFPACSRPWWLEAEKPEKQISGDTHLSLTKPVVALACQVWQGISNSL